MKTRAGEVVKLSVCRGEKLAENALYANLCAAAAKNAKDAPISRLSKELVGTPDVSSEPAETESESPTESQIDSEVVATEAASETKSDEEEKNIAIFDNVALEEIEVTLVQAPLSVVRPSGMVADYADYSNLAGLQAAYYGHDSTTDFFVESGVRKRNGDPASFLTTLGEIDGDALTEWSLDVEKEAAPKRGSAETNLGSARSRTLDAELPGVDLRDGYWDYVPEKSNANVAVFRKSLLARRLEVFKKYELVPEELPESGHKEWNARAYHLKLSLEVKNVDPKASRAVSYLLDGPTGLPLEGAWFSSGRKTGPGWGAYGLRDLVVSMNNEKAFHVVKCWDVAADKTRKSDEIDVDFLGVDGQYFQSTLIPLEKGVAEEQALKTLNRFAYVPIRVGARLEQRPNFTNVSFRMKSENLQLAPAGTAGDSFEKDFLVFTGPKQPKVLEQYGLGKTLVYGWFWFVSIPLLWILHFFHDYVVFNYGLAIVLLTILVRLCVFPLSRKQVVSSIKMQKLQPELTAMKEKYKDNPQEMMQAQQALFRKHGVNPLSGCLPVFIQMPVFIGLYKALSLDVNLYGAPLFTKSVRWCSNLAAPDMAFDWHNFWNGIGWPSFNMPGNGMAAMFSLGPYMNILPAITIALFLIQQKILMPPVVGDDEQARQQRSMRRMMNFMMIFMGFMFFKVPSGLCIYFIVSSLWGLLERRMLPKRDLDVAAPVAVEVENVGATAGVAGFESKKDKRRARAATGRNYEVYELRRDKKGRRISSSKDQAPKSKFRAWWDEIVERAQEQQRLAKSEYEDGRRARANKRRK
ncbi:MAG: YidC/Oxa1 family insertase periplasmic-domain containing protein [Thermoguttaceae bacterium]|nr:YidC/Oxa1 family insertase periplasmic-domain containing protein [Thermoguttaceae bacterium]